MQTDAEIYEATVADTDSVLALIQEYYAFDHMAFDAQALRPGLEQLLADRTLGRVWLFRSEGVGVGYFILTFAFDLEWGGRHGVVTDLYVRADFRGKGLGTAALTQVEETCRAFGFRAYELHAAAENGPARRFYQKWGMQAQDRIPLSKWIG